MTSLIFVALLLVLAGNCLVLYLALTMNPEDLAIWRRWRDQIMDRLK
jgi:hypothetical protein